MGPFVKAVGVSPSLGIVLLSAVLAFPREGWALI